MMLRKPMATLTILSVLVKQLYPKAEGPRMKWYKGPLFQSLVLGTSRDASADA